MELGKFKYLIFEGSVLRAFFHDKEMPLDGGSYNCWLNTGKRFDVTQEQQNEFMALLIGVAGRDHKSRFINIIPQSTVDIFKRGYKVPENWQIQLTSSSEAMIIPVKPDRGSLSKIELKEKAEKDFAVMLNKKFEYYGQTEAAIHFAFAEWYATEFSI